MSTEKEVISALELAQEQVDSVIEKTAKQVKELRDGEYAEKVVVVAVSVKDEWATVKNELEELKTKVRDIGAAPGHLSPSLLSSPPLTRRRSSGGKKPRQNLEVHLPNRDIILQDSAAEGFCRCIEFLGFAKVENLGLNQRGQPLVSRRKQGDECHPRKINGYWIQTSSGTVAKKELLEKIAKRLNKDKEITVKLVEK